MAAHGKHANLETHYLVRMSILRPFTLILCKLNQHRRGSLQELTCWGHWCQPRSCGKTEEVCWETFAVGLSSPRCITTEKYRIFAISIPFLVIQKEKQGKHIMSQRDWWAWQHLVCCTASDVRCKQSDCLYHIGRVTFVISADGTIKWVLAQRLILDLWLLWYLPSTRDVLDTTINFAAHHKFVQNWLKGQAESSKATVTESDGTGTSTAPATARTTAGEATELNLYSVTAADSAPTHLSSTDEPPLAQPSTTAEPATTVSDSSDVAQLSVEPVVLAPGPAVTVPNVQVPASRAVAWSPFVLSVNGIDNFWTHATTESIQIPYEEAMQLAQYHPELSIIIKRFHSTRCARVLSFLRCSSSHTLSTVEG